MSTATVSLYETDFYGWIQRQAAMLRGRDFADVDLDNLIEEVESMGASERRELENRLEVLLAHLLKWQFQPARRSVSWQLAITEQRRRIARHLRKNPSLKGVLPETYLETYDYAVLAAAKETCLSADTFPPSCPWTVDEAVDEGFWPEAPAMAPAKGH